MESMKQVHFQSPDVTDDTAWVHSNLQTQTNVSERLKNIFFLQVFWTFINTSNHVKKKFFHKR